MVPTTSGDLVDAMPSNPIAQHWTLDSIDWSAIQIEAVRRSEALFYLVTAASFMESATDRYTANLIGQFAGDDEVTSWLKQRWLPEETQHGKALRQYVQIAWPHFDWDRVYASFIDEFAAYCGAEELEPTRAQRNGITLCRRDGHCELLHDVEPAYP